MGNYSTSLCSPLLNSDHCSLIPFSKMMAVFTTIVTSSNLIGIFSIPSFHHEYLIYLHKFINIYKYMYANIDEQIFLEACHSCILGTLKLS